MSFGLRNYCRVYRACRHADLVWWRALRPVYVIWRRPGGQGWSAKNNGELKAQLTLIAEACKESPGQEHPSS